MILQIGEIFENEQSYRDAVAIPVAMTIPLIYAMQTNFLLKKSKV